MITTQDLTPTVRMTAHAQDLTPTVMLPALDDRARTVMLAGQAPMAAALADFERRYPAYAGTAVLDGMRARDYTRLDAAGHVYLDYTGGALYAESQLARHRDLLAGAVFGNPHSQNVPSQEAPPGWRRPGRRSWRSSGPHRRSTRSSSPPTPAARCGWSASPIRSGPAASTC